jgi:hypothetical protein
MKCFESVTKDLHEMFITVPSAAYHFGFSGSPTEEGLGVFPVCGNRI